MKLRLIAALAGMAAIALTCAACVQQQGTLGGEDTPPPSPPGQSDELPQEHVHEPVFVEGIEPDCTAPGILAHWECGCGKYFADETCQTPLGEDELILSPDGHEYEPVTTEPTCTEQGYTKYVCSACGDSYIDGSSYTPPSEHDLFVEQVITESDCTHGGERKLACRNCEYVEIEPLPELGHDYKETIVQPECDAEGYTIYSCTRCGDEYKDNFTQKLPHSYEPTVVPSTCTERGYTKYTCTACGHNYIDEQSYTPENGHSYKVAEEVLPDCEHAGHRKFVCGACGDGYTVTLPETGHMWQVAEEGYTQEGAPYTVYVCSACGADRREEGDPPSATEGLIFAAAGDHCAVAGILSNDKAIELVIPSVHDGLPVTEIAESAFEDNLQIISASLPHGLQKIGRRAFAGCANLAEVNIPDTTTAISGSAFRDCRSLISVYYDAKSADDCQSLDIFRNAGRDSGGLTLYVGKGVERIPALLFSASGADTAPNLTDIVFEEGCALSEIGEAAFTGCAYLKEIAMPASLEIIGAEAFLDCSELEYVSCPEGVQIGAAAFGGTADDLVIEYYSV
ncbi:MAG TPA: leucine-rich repeat domain-containing protein [Candidatus Coproplasma avistercoris]|nr:leucine-rich repeat domain-containing protein [Candidatus Coproplasma avistercoris]